MCVLPPPWWDAEPPGRRWVCERAPRAIAAELARVWAGSCRAACESVSSRSTLGGRAPGPKPVVGLECRPEGLSAALVAGPGVAAKEGRDTGLASPAGLPMAPAGGTGLLAASGRSTVSAIGAGVAVATGGASETGSGEGGSVASGGTTGAAGASTGVGPGAAPESTDGPITPAPEAVVGSGGSAITVGGAGAGIEGRAVSVRA